MTPKATKSSKPSGSSKAIPSPLDTRPMITIICSDGLSFEVHSNKLMSIFSLSSAIEGRCNEPRILTLTDATLGRGEVISLFVDLLVDGQCKELKGDSLPDTWAGVKKYVDLVLFLENVGLCEDLIALFCNHLRKAVEAKKLTAVWGVVIGGVAKDINLMATSLKNGDINATWTDTDNALATDGLTAAQGLALMTADAANGGEKLLLGANRLDPGSWSKEMRNLIHDDYLLALCAAWTKVDEDVHLLEGHVAMSPTEVGSDDGKGSPSPSLFVRTSSYSRRNFARRSSTSKRNLLSRGGAAYFSRRLAGIPISTASNKDDFEQEMTDFSRPSGTGSTSSETDPMVAVWKQYAFEFKSAYSEIRRRAPIVLFEHPVPIHIPASGPDRVRHILAYSVVHRSRMNEQL